LLKVCLTLLIVAKTHRNKTNNLRGESLNVEWFEQEIETAHNHGVTHPGNLPFFTVPTNPNGQAVLLIHGYCASPQEMMPLAEILLQHHITVCGVRLPGHGTSPADLVNRSATEWLTTVKQGYQFLIERDYRVSVAGLSTGALLALTLAQHQTPEKLLLLAPFLRLQHPMAPFTGILSHFIRYQNRSVSVTEQQFYYQQRPLSGVAQIIMLCHQLKKQLNQIKTPALTLTSTGDRTIATGTATKLQQQLGSKIKPIHCYDDSVPHALLSIQNPQRDDVLNRSLNFLNTLVD